MINSKNTSILIRMNGCKAQQKRERNMKRDAGNKEGKSQLKGF